MATLFDIFRYNNIPYYELADELGKKEIEYWIEKIKDTQYAKLLLTYYSSGTIDIITRNKFDGDHEILSSDIPEDLVGNVCITVYPSS